MKNTLKIIPIFLILLLFLASCNKATSEEIDGKMYSIQISQARMKSSNISEIEEVSELAAQALKLSNAYFGDYYLSGTKYSVSTLTEIDNIADISELKKFMVDDELYYYNIYHFNDDKSEYDFLILYKYDEELKKVVVNNILTVDRIYQYDELNGNENFDVNVFGVSDFNEIDTTGVLRHTELRKATPQILLDYDLVNDTGDKFTKNTAYVYLTDKGFACVCYDSNNTYQRKFVLNNPELNKLYELYTQYDSNII